eukprot:scaffold462_cov195-Pinguiococcus_pyrenoidosus.AAC.46
MGRTSASLGSCRSPTTSWSAARSSPGSPAVYGVARSLDAGVMSSDSLATAEPAHLVNSSSQGLRTDSV